MLDTTTTLSEELGAETTSDNGLTDGPTCELSGGGISEADADRSATSELGTGFTTTVVGTTTMMSEDKLIPDTEGTSEDGVGSTITVE